MCECRGRQNQRLNQLDGENAGACACMPSVDAPNAAEPYGSDPAPYGSDPEPNECEPDAYGSEPDAYGFDTGPAGSCAGCDQGCCWYTGCAYAAAAA